MIWNLLDRVIIQQTPMNPKEVLSKDDCPKSPKEVEEMADIHYQESIWSFKSLAGLLNARAKSVLYRFYFALALCGCFLTLKWNALAQ
jgi:hypothetical protein